MKKVLLVIITILLITGCENSNSGVKPGMISCKEKDEVMSIEGSILIDVRTLEEYNEGHLDGAINIPYDVIENTIDNYTDIKKDTNIVIYCRSGNRSKKAYETLKELGFTNIYDLGAITKCV